MKVDVRSLVSSALQNAEDNGDGDALRAMSFGQQAADLLDADADIEGLNYDAVLGAIVDYRLNEKPKDFVKILNQVQYEGQKHRLLDPIHAIRFALSVYDGLDFLRAWNEGDWKGCLEWNTWKDFK